MHVKLNKLKDQFILLYHENKWYWFLILTLIIGGSIYRLKRQHDLDKYGVYGVAKVIHYSKLNKGNLMYQYFVDGETYTKGITGYPIKCENNSCIGRLYEIKYVPQNPNICMIYFDRPLE